MCEGKVICLHCMTKFWNPLSRRDNDGAAPSFALNPYGYIRQDEDIQLPHNTVRGGTRNDVPQALQCAEGTSTLNHIRDRGLHRVFPVHTGYETGKALITGQKPTIARRRIYIPVPQYYLDSMQGGNTD